MEIDIDKPFDAGYLNKEDQSDFDIQFEKDMVEGKKFDAEQEKKKQTIVKEPVILTEQDGRDYTVEELQADGGLSFTGRQRLRFDGQKRKVEKNKQHRLDLAQEDSSAKTEAWWANFRNNNILSKAYKGLESTVDDHAVESGYKPTDEGVWNTIAVSKIDNKHFQELRSSKSSAEYKDRLQEAIANKVVDDKIKKSLSDSGRMSSSIAGAVLDIDSVAMVASGGLGLVSKSMSIAKLVAAEGSLETALIWGHSEYDEDYTMEDLFFDGSIGVASLLVSYKIAASITKKKKLDQEEADLESTNNEILLIEYKPKSPDELETFKIERDAEIERVSKLTEDEKITEARVNLAMKMQANGSSEDEIALALKEEHPTWQDTFNKKQSDKDKRKNELESKKKELSEIDKADGTGSEPKYFNFKQDKRTKEAEAREVRRLELIDETKAIEAEDAREFEIELRIERENKREIADRIEQRRLNSELADRFNNPKYEPYNANRREFFDKQNKTPHKADGGIIEDIKVKSDVIVTKIKKYVKEIRELKKTDGNESAIKYRERTIKALEKTKDALTAKVNKLIENNSITPAKAKLLNIVDGAVESVQESATEFVKNIKTLSREETNDMIKTLDDMEVDMSDDVKGIYKELKSRGSIKEVSAKVIKKVLNSKMSKKEKAIAITAMMSIGAASANASDGGNESSVSDFILIAFATAIAYKLGAFGALKNVYKKYGNKDGLKDISDNISKHVDDATTQDSPDGKVKKKIRDSIVDLMDTRFTSTLARFRKTGGKAFDIANRLLFSTEYGSGAETMKQIWNWGTMKEYGIAERIRLAEYKKELKLSDSGLKRDSEILSSFRRELTRGREQGTHTSDAIMGMVNDTKGTFRNPYEIARTYGAKGYDKIVLNDNHISRLWKNRQINGMLRDLDAKTISKITEALAKSIEKKSGNAKQSYKQAEMLIKYWSDASRLSSKKEADSLFSDVSSLLKDDVDLSEWIKATTTDKDMSKRAMSRIDFNMYDFDDALREFNIKDASGKPIIVDNFMETDAKVILDRTALRVHADAALARVGFESEFALNEEIALIRKSGKTAEADDLEKIRDMILGKPLHHSDDDTHAFSQFAKNTVIVVKLPFVLLSMSSELIMTLANGGVFNSIQTSYAIAKNAFGKGTELERQLANITSGGSGIDRRDFSGYLGLSENGEDLEDKLSVGGKALDLSRRARDISLVFNGMIPATDAMIKVNQGINADVFARWVKGDNSLISDKRLQSYGLSIDDREMFKDMFEFNDNGFLKAVDETKMSQQQKDKFSEVLFAMGNNQNLQSQIGTSPLWGRTSAIGRLVTSLIGYPMEQFNAHGLGGIRNMDRIAMYQTLGAFSGTVIGLNARYALQGKEVEDDVIVTYALMSIPALGALSGLKSMTSPVVFDVFADALKLISFTGDSEEKQFD